MPSLPFVSIILPVRNEAATIEGCLRCILRQTYPAELMEIIVVDGVSSDETVQVIKRVAQDFPHLQIAGNEGKIVPTGMNIGIRMAKGDYIVRVDGHTEIAPDYVFQCIQKLIASGAGNAGGKMTAVGKTAFGRAVASATSTPFGIGNSRFHYSDQEEWVDSVYMGAWPRYIFAQIGLFDEELVRDQDDEFNYRLREHGGRILLSPDIQSVYTVRGTPGRLWRQYFQYGFWKVRILQKHPGQMSARQFVPPVFVSVLLISAILSVFASIGRILLGAAVGSYLLANIAASVITAGKQGWKQILLLPAVFAILHLSYGTGFLAGLVRFAGRWKDRLGKTPRMENPHVAE